MNLLLVKKGVKSQNHKSQKYLIHRPVIILIFLLLYLPLTSISIWF